MTANGISRESVDVFFPSDDQHTSVLVDYRTMLIKEYRVPMPMSVEEYRIAQLYMIVKKSREETTEAGSGVEIIKNEPYTNGPGGDGQYTFKIFHIERHLPAWFKAIVPANAMIIEEEAWNAYPYTKTRYRCPFVERFMLDIETSYEADLGTQGNLFHLKAQELTQRAVEFIDIAQSQPSPDVEEEDPTIFHSEKTGRGPLTVDWFEQAKKSPKSSSLMCAYKLCRVEFRYWGMQSKCERFIHDTGLRKMILRAHRQAWCWQDEYQGLTLADIRRLEDETQRELNRRMAQFLHQNQRLSVANSSEEQITSNRKSSKNKRTRRSSNEKIIGTRSKFDPFPIPDDETLDEEFFDAESFLENHPNRKASRSHSRSVDDIQLNDSIYSDTYLSTHDDSLNNDHKGKCPTDILILIFYGGNIFSTEESFLSAKKTDFLSFRSTFENVLRSHYSRLQGKIAIRFVECRSISIDAIELLHRLSPYGALSSISHITQSETVPINALPLFAVSNPNYPTILNNAIASANKVYQEFLLSQEGQLFSGQIVLIGDANGAILAYDALCTSQSLDDASSLDEDGSRSQSPVLSKGLINRSMDGDLSQSFPRVSRYRSLNTKQRFPSDPLSSTEETIQLRQVNDGAALAFTVNEFFSFGSPLSMILAYRRMMSDTVVRPSCGQMYNLFHGCDPNAARLEPLIRTEFSQIPACCIPRYSQYPLGDGQSTLLVECIDQYSNLFFNASSATSDGLVNGSNSDFSDLRQTWWGSRRIDYIVYSPESLIRQPAHILPIVFHSSYWESCDVIAFLLRNVTRYQEPSHFLNYQMKTDQLAFTSNKSTEGWLHRMTAVKIRNLAPNHRANDTIVIDARPQTISGKFFYGPIDMVSLADERVDIYVMRSAPYGEWMLLDTVETDFHGRLRYTIPENKKLPIGLHPVKLVVRGDHSSVDLYITVLPPKSEAVIFSIDGAFKSRISVRHHNPKVRPGAVDVVRYWQELGYIIIYVTARPDIQQHKVVHWLAQHNFPHGMTMFNSRITREPIRQKGDMIRAMVENADLIIVAGYGTTKDVPIYQSIHVPAERTFVVGKMKKSLHSQVQWIPDGYALHLAELSQPGVVRASKSDSRHLIRRACFNLSKLSSLRRTPSLSSLVNDSQPSSPSGYSTKSMPLVGGQHQLVSETPSTNRKANKHDDNNQSSQHQPLILRQPNSKAAPSRGISPRMHPNAALIKSNHIYNPSSIEHL